MFTFCSLAPLLAACRNDEIKGDYSELLASSIFCLVVPGDGWSARMEDAMLHGCIPVIIMVRLREALKSGEHWLVLMPLQCMSCLQQVPLCALEDVAQS